MRLRHDYDGADIRYFVILGNLSTAQARWLILVIATPTMIEDVPTKRPSFSFGSRGRKYFALEKVSYQVPIPCHLCYCCGALNSSCGGTDDIDHHVGVGEHGNVPAGDLRPDGAHTLSHEPLHVG